jgi:hypothetical protein
MPHVPDSILRRQREAAALAEWTEFENGFQRSRRGNLWRHYDGLTVTVFERREGRYGWCIVADEDEKRFSQTGYESESEAIRALGYELDVGRWFL